MGSFGGIEWLRKHECPPAFDRAVAQGVYDAHVYPGAPPMHPKTKARLVISWRKGYLRTHGERRAAELRGQRMKRMAPV
jgi:hypothetical protein